MRRLTTLGHPESGAEKRERERRERDAKREKRWSLKHPKTHGELAEATANYLWFNLQARRAKNDREDRIYLGLVFGGIGVIIVGSIILAAIAGVL